MTLAQLRTFVAAELGLDANADGTGTECPLVDEAINKGVVRVLQDTHCYVAAASLTGFNGTTGDYALDASILEIEELYFTGATYLMERVSQPALLRKRLVAQPSSSPVLYYALAGANMLQFYPTPSTTDTLNIYYVPAPAALSASSDDPSTVSLGGIPIQLHEAIEFYACFKGGSYDDDSSSAQGQRYHDLYDKELIRYTKLLRRKGGQRNARASVNDSRRRNRLHDNSVYYSGSQ